MTNKEHNNMISVKHTLLVAIACAMVFVACDDDESTTVPHANVVNGGGSSTTDRDTSATISSTTIEANRFVYEVLQTYYYWNTEIPNVDYSKQADTEEFFYDLLSTKDRFSYITSDVDEYEAEEQGNYTSLGWEFTLSYIDTTSTDVVAIINQVYDNTPASRAGAKRGDVIYTVNGTQMNKDNYYDLLYSGTSYTFGGYRVQTPISYSMTKEAITISPVSITKTFALDDGRLCGYMLFNEYKSTFDDEMLAALSSLKAEGVEEMILDLRYNNGGYVSTGIKLNSALAPAEVASAHEPMMYYEFNKTLQRAYPDYYSADASMEYFTDTVGVNLDLDRIVILCGGGTFSAAEATIWCLKPYMDVVTIGETTGGKNSMMYLLSPSDFTNSYTGEAYYSSSIDNWLMAPIVAIYKNATGEAFDTSDGTGMDPDYTVNEYSGLMSTGLKQLGDSEENLIAAALEYLNTGAVSTTKAMSRRVEAITSSVGEKPHLFVKPLPETK